MNSKEKTENTNILQEKILELLSSLQNKKLTTYEIAKRLHANWSTVKTHLFELEQKNKVSFTFDNSTFRRRRLWQIKKCFKKE